MGPSPIGPMSPLGTDNEWLARTPSLRNHNSCTVRRCPPTSPQFVTIKHPWRYCFIRAPLVQLFYPDRTAPRETKKTASSFQRYSHSSPPLPLHDSDLHYPPPFPHRSRSSLLILSKSYCPPHLYRTIMPAQRTRDTPTYCASSSSSSLTTILTRVLTLDIPQHSK